MVETTPHVLIFPFPIQGHINSMLKLAEVLCLSGISVTFVNTQRNHSRHLCFADVQSRFGRFPRSRLEAITDGLSDQPHSSGFSSLPDFLDLLNRVKNVMKPGFRELLQIIVSCIIADGILGFAIDVAQELGIPSISFRTISACGALCYLCLPKLIDNGEIPFKDEDMDRLVKNVPGMESFPRCRDLPSFFTETSYSVRAAAHILNTFDDIEAPIISHLRSSYWPNLYTIGPLNALLSTLRRSSSSSSTNSSSSESISSNASLYEEDRKSVVYVSFGSLAVVSQEQWLELWYGLVNSSHRFLWVRRPDSLIDKDNEKKEVLNHPSVGAFLTHSGWNSTLESMVAGVPMVCWPHSAEQQVNSRYMSEVWKIGMDMKDNCNRSTVEKSIRDMMDGEKREELMKSTTKVSEMAQQSIISRNGSSYRNYEALLDFIRKIVLRLCYVMLVFQTQFRLYHNSKI
ncbi:hypothetical protein MKX01_042794 [Papaver californicum]|nr:hypothetical protein MKX01_042794 [Papaver californicum]